MTGWNGQGIEGVAGARRDPGVGARRRPRRARRATAALALVVLGACSSGSSDAATPSGEGEGSSTTVAASTTTAGPLTGSEVVEGLRRSVALVETPAGSGSAVLLADGYLVTNAHVVDPFRRVTVTVDGSTHDVDVVGVDLVTDIAVLGPVPPSSAGAPVALADPGRLGTGDDLYLVGFPGDAEDAELTIAEGVLSRRREVRGWDLELLQTDAGISGGQSGGALADAEGQVVGISGYAYDETFALALGGPEVQASVDAILDGEGSEWERLPPWGEPRDQEATLDLTASGVSVLLVPNVRDLPRMEVRVDPAVPVELEVVDLAFETVALNEAADAYLREDPEDDPSARPKPTAPDEPGVWTFDIAIDEPVLLLVATADGQEQLDIATDQRFMVLNPAVEPAPLAVGKPVEGTVGAFADTDVYALDLEAGEAVTVTVSSAFGDMAFSLVGPGDGEGIDADDGGGGLWDLDAEGSFRATTAGTHLLYVSQVEGFAAAYRVVVDPA